MIHDCDTDAQPVDQDEGAGLAALLAADDLTPADQLDGVARPMTFVHYVTAGVLDGVSVGGRLYVRHGQVLALARTHTDLDRSAHAHAAQLAAGRALTGYLRAHDVHADWGQARRSRSPLVCTRRGRPAQLGQLSHHGVVLDASWVRSWLATREAHPLPVGPAFAALLCELDGIAAARRVTALASSSAHRVGATWVRLDTDVWRVRVPDAVQARMEQP